MHISPSFVADGKAAKAVEPGEGALDDPAMATQALARLDAYSAPPMGRQARIARPISR